MFDPRLPHLCWPLAAVLVLCTLGVACAPPAASARDARGERGLEHLNELDFRCARAVMPRDSVYRMPLADAERDPELARRLELLPYRARRAALAAGLEPLLARLLLERETKDAREPRGEPGPASAALADEQELELRLGALDAQLTAASFEAGCTAAAIRRVLEDLAQAEQDRQLSLALATLVVGAAAGTASGVWGLAEPESNAPQWLGIVGGLTATGLAGAALVHVERDVAFEHPRNRLTPIWQGTDPDHLYPSFVLRMLTAPDTEAGRAPRDELLASWRHEISTLDPPQRQAALERMFAGGGVYTQQELEVRAKMFDGVESAVRGIARDMELLSRSLVRVLAVPTP